MASSVPLAEISSCGWNVLREDVPLPVAVLKEAQLRHNCDWMRRFVEASGISFAPHGKTTMAPALFDMQLANGAWAITVATPHQIQVARQFGYKRIILANQLVGRSAIDYVLSELSSDLEFEFYCLVDSGDNLRQLSKSAAAANLRQRINALVEMGYPGGRTGCRSVEEGLSLAREVAATGTVTLSGVEGFEGLLRGRSPSDSASMVNAFLDSVVELARACDAEGLFGAGTPILSAGGSAYFDLVVEKFSTVLLSRAPRIVLRSGCYITHDSLMYTVAFERMRQRSGVIAAMGEGLKPALEVWAYVQSRPEKTLLIVGLGKRDISHDELPVPIAWFRPGESAQPTAIQGGGHSVTGLNDQHCYITAPSDSPLQVGDMVAFGVSHPCLTFDKWRVIHIVDANYNITDSIRTYF
jgi:D-serine dehydratase